MSGERMNVRDVRIHAAMNGVGGGIYWAIHLPTGIRVDGEQFTGATRRKARVEIYDRLERAVSARKQLEPPP